MQPKPQSLHIYRSRFVENCKNHPNGRRLVAAPSDAIVTLFAECTNCAFSPIRHHRL
jgi:hypothetical protein